MMAIRELDVQDLLNEFGIPFNAENPLGQFERSDFFVIFIQNFGFHFVLLFFYDLHFSAGESRKGALYENEALVFFNLNDFAMAGSHANVAGVPGHPAALNGTLRRRGSVRTRSAQTVFLAVALGTTVETIAFYDALEAAALAQARNFDHIPFFDPFKIGSFAQTDGRNRHRFFGFPDLSHLHFFAR
jgi:hypothetical protein